MGNAISLIIALVGVLNFVNSMVTAIVSRKREFAMIQSVGMTKRQLRKMLVSEGLFYAGITLLVSVTVSSAAICTVIRWMTEGGYSTWHFTPSAPGFLRAPSASVCRSGSLALLPEPGKTEHCGAAADGVEPERKHRKENSGKQEKYRETG